MTQPGPRRYLVVWSDDDGEYVATCPDYPSLSYLAVERRAALTGLDDLIESIDFYEDDENPEDVLAAYAAAPEHGVTRKPDGLRAGQAAFNTLYLVRPDLADEIRGGDLDPFYRDDRLPAFWDWIQSQVQPGP